MFVQEPPESAATAMVGMPWQLLREWYCQAITQYCIVTYCRFYSMAEESDYLPIIRNPQKSK